MRQGTWQNSNRSRSKSGLFSSKHHQQQESGGIIHYITVCIYIVFVSLPAVSLFLYYTNIWDPNYVNEKLALAHNNRSDSMNPHRVPLVDQQMPKCDCNTCLKKQFRDTQPKINLRNILASLTSPKPKT